MMRSFGKSTGLLTVTLLFLGAVFAQESYAQSVLSSSWTSPKGDQFPAECTFEHIGNVQIGQTPVYGWVIVGYDQYGPIQEWQLLYYVPEIGQELIGTSVVDGDPKYTVVTYSDPQGNPMQSQTYSHHEASVYYVPPANWVGSYTKWRLKPLQIPVN